MSDFQAFMCLTRLHETVVIMFVFLGALRVYIAPLRIRLRLQPPVRMFVLSLRALKMFSGFQLFHCKLFSNCFQSVYTNAFAVFLWRTLPCKLGFISEVIPLFG